jgi:hypothetical protein
MFLRILSPALILIFAFASSMVIIHVADEMELSLFHIVVICFVTGWGAGLILGMLTSRRSRH